MRTKIESLGWQFPTEKFCERDRVVRQHAHLFARNYAQKHAIAEALRPDRILEIGVRAGYSGYAFLSAVPQAEYVGLDADNGKHGGDPYAWSWYARELLQEFKAKVLVVDTQTLVSLEEFGQFDMIHVDGDHSTRGCRHDMDLCWEALIDDGVMIVDDYTFLRSVRKAVDAFIRDHQGVVARLCKTRRGDMLISRGRDVYDLELPF